jgi:emp24/gp25L/p24 family/GOLD
MSTELRRLEAMVKEIHQEMLHLRSREEEMRNINGACSLIDRHVAMPAHAVCMLHVHRSIHDAFDDYDLINAEATNARVAWFSIGSLFVCIFLAAWQLWYLKVGDIILQCSLHYAVDAELTPGAHKLLRDSVRMLHAALLLKKEAAVTLNSAEWGVEEFCFL